jgi:hypothetical protein
MNHQAESELAMTTGPLSHGRVLHSWKEIATYMGRGVRTIQRYESKLGFPIRRPAGTPRSAVLAFSAEIDRWLDKSPMKSEAEPTAAIRIAGEIRSDEPRTDHATGAQSVYSKAKLQRQRAEQMRLQLQKTHELVAEMTASVQKSRLARKQARAIAEANNSYLHALREKYPEIAGGEIP